MNKLIALFLLVTSLAWAGLPPTTSKFSGDSAPVTTFELDFPNFNVTHSGIKATAGTLAIGGGGTGLASMTAHSVLLGSTTSVQQTISSTVGAPLISQGSSSDPLFGAFDLSNTSIINNSLGVSHGGTGLASDTAYSLLAGGTTSTGALQQVSGVGSSGQVLTSNGASALPTWQASSPAFSGLTQFGTIYAGTSTTVLSTAAGSAGQPLVSNATSAPTYQTLGVSGGGHGVSSLTAYSLIAGGTTTTAAVQQIAAGSTTGQVLTYQGSSALPTWVYPSTVSTVQATYSLSSSSSPGSNTQINFDNKITDTNNAVTTGVGWKFTVPVAGNYLVQMAGQTASGTPDLFVYKNGTSTAKLFTMTTGSFQSSGSVILPFALNDTIDIRPNTGVTLAGSAAPYQTYVSIQLAPGGGNISTNGSGGFHIESAMVSGTGATLGSPSACSSGTCAILNPSTAGWISVAWNSAGLYTATFAAGTFSAAPVCTCSANGNGADTYCESYFGTGGETSTNLQFHSSANIGFSVICMGPR